MKEDIDRWNQKFAGRALNAQPEPDNLLVECPWLPPAGKALDIASGSGQNAVYLAQLGFDVTAIDGSKVGMELATRLAEHCSVNITAVVADLDDYNPQGNFDLIIVFHYLNRELFGKLASRLNPGGILAVKTFNQDFLDKRPTFNPDYVLKPGELSGTFTGLEALLDEESPEHSPGKSIFVGRK